ncbi:uncharacterized protein LOC130803689 [Amaranthus tricolor]|uniref:uncharacterized protein LOC130803689 n=1 Tax=Amaranthus tricolor TaxID=29722 RepID=UPI00258A6812|nr:uncharacterized protein LOC130803689 [Amaranthus tricolor]
MVIDDREQERKTDARYEVCRKTITRLWKEVHKQKKNNNTAINLNNKRIGRQAPNKIQFEDEKFKSIKFELKGTQHSVAKQIEVSQSTISRWKKDIVIRKHTNAIKHTLNDNNKLHRLSFALSKLQYEEHIDYFKFKPHNNIVHIDEKHFYLTRELQTYYLGPGEVEPHREWIWPFITQEPAKRSSKNRKRGELETKSIQSITKEHMRSILITNVLPTIRAKWPHGMSKHIFIQQDNAKPHIAHNDNEFMEEALNDDFLQQPPNSHDMNVLDLDFFRSIQALFVFITLQACMIETSDGHRASYPEPKPFATSSEPGNRETTGKKLPEPDLRTAGRNRNRSR